MFSCPGTGGELRHLTFLDTLVFTSEIGENPRENRSNAVITRRHSDTARTVPPMPQSICSRRAVSKRNPDTAPATLPYHENRMIALDVLTLTGRFPRRSRQARQWFNE